MPNPYHYRTAINRLVRLTGPTNPSHVQLRAVIAIARELSPSNPRSAINNRMLQSIDAYEYARHTLRDLYDRADSLVGTGASHLGEADLASDSERDASEEDDDPL